MKENMKDIGRIVWYLGWRFALTVAIFSGIIALASWEWWR